MCFPARLQGTLQAWQESMHFLPVTARAALCHMGNAFQILFLEATREKAKSDLQLEASQGLPAKPADLGAQPLPRPVSTLRLSSL